MAAGLSMIANHVWQSTVFATAVALLVLACRKQGAQSFWCRSRRW
jgi:hypothetical protein